jgi:hypothetical protein
MTKLWQENRGIAFFFLGREKGNIFRKIQRRNEYAATDN